MGTAANPTETTPDLGRDMVRQVAEARKVVAHLDGQFGERYAAFTAANQELIGAPDDAEALLRRKEQELRDFAVARYASTQDKRPAPGVGIRITTQAEILDEASAIAWAKVSGVGLQLDERAIKKTALAAPGALPFVKITETASATLAADLDQALAEAVA